MTEKKKKRMLGLMAATAVGMVGGLLVITDNQETANRSVIEATSNGDETTVDALVKAGDIEVTDLNGDGVFDGQDFIYLCRQLPGDPLVPTPSPEQPTEPEPQYDLVFTDPITDQDKHAMASRPARSWHIHDATIGHPAGGGDSAWYVIVKDGLAERVTSTDAWGHALRIASAQRTMFRVLKLKTTAEQKLGIKLHAIADLGPTEDVLFDDFECEGPVIIGPPNREDLDGVIRRITFRDGVIYPTYWNHAVKIWGKTSNIIFEDVTIDGSRLKITPQVLTGFVVDVYNDQCVPANITLRRCQITNYPNTKLLDSDIPDVTVED